MIDKIRKVIKPVNRGEANVEAEKGETIVTYLFGISIPEHYKIEGKKHEKGGTPLKVPDGSFVFSDDKKMIVDDPNILKFFGESKPKTPAQIAKKYELNEYKAKLIDPDTDQISKITSALMLKNNYEKLAQLALYQEAKKGFKDGVPKFAEDYLASIGIEPDQLIEAVKGKMEEKIYEKPSVDEQGNPIMQEGGDPTNPNNYPFLEPKQPGRLVKDEELDVKLRLDIPKELEFNIQDVNKRLEDPDTPFEEVNIPSSKTKSDNKIVGVIEEPVDDKPVLQNTTEPKGKDVAEKRKWLQSEEGKKWLESEWGKQWLQSKDGEKYQQELRYNKLTSIANKLLPNEPIEITMGGMDGIANLTMMATEASKWNLGKPKSQQFSADNVFQPVKGIDRGDYSAAGSTYGQFRPNEQTPKYTEAIPYAEGGDVKDGEESRTKMNLTDKINNYLRNKMGTGGEPEKDNSKNTNEDTVYRFPIFFDTTDNTPKIFNPQYKPDSSLQNTSEHSPHYTYKSGSDYDRFMGISGLNDRDKNSYYIDNTGSTKQEETKQEETKTEEQNKIEEQYKPKIKRKYYTQDIRNIAAALGQLAGVKMYLPWSAPIDYMVPRAVYYDPTREIQGAATVANTQGKLMQAYLSPQSAMANMSEQQARLAEQTANIVANAQQRNVGVANQMEQQRAGIYNQAANMERARQQELYNQTITARQQYDNSRRKALAGYIAALNQADENAARAYNLSNIVFADSPFYIDPATGQIEIDKSRVKLDKSKTPDKSLEERIKESYKEYKSAGIPDSIIESLIKEQYFGGSGKSTKKKDDKDSESEKNINR